MSNKLFFSLGFIICIIISGCKPGQMEYNKLYDAYSSSVTGKINFDDINIKIDNSDFSLMITASVPEQEPFVGVFGTDGVNLFHEVKGYHINEIIIMLLKGIDKTNIVTKNLPGLPPVDFYFESHYPKEYNVSINDKIRRLVDILGNLFNFVIYRENVMTDVYHFYLDTPSTLEAFYIKLDESRYCTGTGLLLATNKNGEIITSNFDEQKNEYYVQFNDLLKNLSCSGNFQYQDHIDNQGSLALPYEIVSYSFEASLDFLLRQCELWGVRIEIVGEEKETIFIKYGDM